MTKNIRVRFAPSPTGPLHIGGVRTALFNYLFAKKHNGTFVLRIEDTDQSRYVDGAEQYIIDALNWCGIPYDEGVGKEGKYGPYRQSERKHLYKEYADKLIASGNAYYAFDTSEELDFHRKDHEAKGKTFIYNWHNRLKLKNSLSLSAEKVQAKLNSGDDYVIRFKSPQDETLHLTDIIRGDITIDTNVLDDKVLFKSDGMPTYHLANIVDDHLMEITHVIRGEEWLPSLALHYQLYDAFGWEKPEFAHLPLLLKPDPRKYLNKNTIEKFTNIYCEEFLEKYDYDLCDSKKIIKSILENFRNLPQILKINDNKDSKIKKDIKTVLKKGMYGKLSKRDGDKLGFPVFPLEWKDPKTGDVSKGYKEEGYFPEAVVNFLVFLGWNPGTEQEIFSLNELIEAFDLEKVHKAGARFDPDKIKWLQHHYFQQKSSEELTELFISEFSEDGDSSYLSIKTLNEPFRKHYESFTKEKVVNIIDLILSEKKYSTNAFSLVKERATFVSDLWNLSHYFFIPPTKYDQKAIKKINIADSDILLSQLIPVLNNIKEWKSFSNTTDLETKNLITKIIETQIKGWITSKAIGFGKVMMPLRLALVGDLKGPEVFDIMFMIGKHETIKRIENIIHNL